MTTLRNLIILGIVLAIGTISVESTPLFEGIGTFFGRAKNESHHLVVGNREYGDRSVHQEKIAEKYLWTGQKLILNRTVEVPYNSVITQVRCLDQATDGTGAEATIFGGGPGFNYVNLRFKSQRWHGIYFNVEVFAKTR